MKKNFNRWISLALVFLLLLSLLPGGAAALSETVTVKIIGEDSVVLNTSVDMDSVGDYTTSGGEGKNALDAVIQATLDHGFSADSNTITYNPDYGSYSLEKIAGVAPTGVDYLGTLASSASGTLDSLALSAHPLTAGDTYTVYYVKGSAGYVYQTYASFAADSVSGAAGSVIPLEVTTVGYDDSYNACASGLSGAIIYASGGAFAAACPIAVTDAGGKAYLVFSQAGDYTLSLSSDYTFARCTVHVAGDSVTLYDVSVQVTDGTDGIDGASLTLTDSSGAPHSPYGIGTEGTYTYRLPAGTYTYRASADEFVPADGSFAVSGETGQTVTLTPMSGYAVSILPGNPSLETVTVKNSTGTIKSPVSVYGGEYLYDLVNGDYTYTVSRIGYHSGFASFTVSGAEQTITAAALTDEAAEEAEWPAFRDFNDNIASGSHLTAQGSWQAEEAWKTSLGSLGAWGTLSVSNLVLHDGYLYAATEHGLSKLVSSTGELIATSPLSEDTGYATQIACGDGKIFVTTSAGVDAFDPLTMELLWSAPISAYGDYMPSTPILYDGSHTIYVGDFGDGNYTLGTYGGYSAIDTAAGTGKWILYGGETDARYWAGAVIAGNYLVFGSDSGSLTSVGIDTTDISFGCLTAVADTLSVTGKIRSSIAWDGNYFYFTTSSGYLYKVTIDSGTGSLAVADCRQFASSSTSTPAVYGGRIYVGANDGIYVLDADDLSQICCEATDGAVQSSALVTTAYGDTVYAYFTVNSPRGEIIAVADDGTSVSCDTLCTPSVAQYSNASLIADSAGTLYYANDSGYVFAIADTGETKTDKAKITVSVTPSSAFDSATYATSYPSVTVKNKSGTVVSTASSGVYYLAAGSYSYKVSLTGYKTATGSFTVSASDLSAGAKTVSVTLSSSSGSASGQLTVSVTVTGENNEVWADVDLVSLSEDATVWDAVKKVLTANSLDYEAESSSLGVYVASVNGLAEFDRGANSGWKYSVNGKAPGVSIGSYPLSDGDEVVLYYISDYTAESGFTSSAPATATETELAAALNASSGLAEATLSGSNLTAFLDGLEQAGDEAGSEALLSITLPDGAEGWSLCLPKSTIDALEETKNTSLCIETGLVRLTIDPEALNQIGAFAGSGGITVSAAGLDSSTLSGEARKLIGCRPAYQLSIASGNNELTQFGSGKIEIQIPYTPGKDEDQNAIVACYLDSSESAEAVRGGYRAETGAVDFTVSHFSAYAVGYRKVTFADVADGAWYSGAVTFCSARGITGGTGDGAFRPDGILTRGECIVMLLRAYEIEPLDNPADNFNDAGNAYYSSYLASAKKLGISSSTGNNAFAPEREITRQEMLTMLYRALDVLGELPATEGKGTVSNFSDAGEISDYARAAVGAFVESGAVAGSGGRLEPSGYATRAQMAQILCRLLSL
ncbi:hypothetical protein SDC9_57021 [bioreactor metagenome]|uniref:SLH domain-containing protein n=1 Tax=bioreactor metagenome TaxID=1076179 RepID=A0A644X405_9ZZZZ